MAYQRSSLISRAGYSGVGAWYDTVGDVLKGAVNIFGSAQQATGAQQALAAQNAALLAQQQNKGIDMTTVLVLGAVGVGAVLLLRKKKPKTGGA